MEVDYGALTECKEGGYGALVRLHQSTEVASSDISIQMNHGQFYI
jgi:hypothetical protein